MQPAKLLAEGVALARKVGYQIREEDLAGAGGGHCYYGGKKWLLLDLTQSADEQLRDVIDAMRFESGAARYPTSPQLAETVAPQQRIKSRVSGLAATRSGALPRHMASTHTTPAHE